MIQMKKVFILFIIIISSFTLKAQLSDAKKEEFNKFISQADAFFSQNKYVEAKEIYEKALAINPSDTYAKNQRDKTITLSKKETGEEEGKNYQKIINKADDQFNLKNLEAAKSLYQRALGLKPNDPYPKRKIEEIDALLNAKNIVKSEPLPDLGISTNLSVSEADKILNDAETKRQDSKKNKIENQSKNTDKIEEDLMKNKYNEINVATSEINRVNIKTESINNEMKHLRDSNSNFINVKQHETVKGNDTIKRSNYDKIQESTKLISDKNFDFDSTVTSTKSNPVEIDIYLTLNVTRFTDSLAVLEKKNKEDMIYKIDELNSKNVKEEKNKNDEILNAKNKINTKLDSTLNNISDNDNSNIMNLDKKINESKNIIENTPLTNTTSDFEAPNSLGATYSEGVTEESFQQNDENGLAKSIITRRVVVKNGHGSIYIRTMTKESITYSKDNNPITEQVWQIETQNAKFKRN